jgi:hypothetical protein
LDADRTSGIEISQGNPSRAIGSLKAVPYEQGDVSDLEYGSGITPRSGFRKGVALFRTIPGHRSGQGIGTGQERNRFASLKPSDINEAQEREHKQEV